MLFTFAEDEWESYGVGKNYDEWMIGSVVGAANWALCEEW